MEHFFNVIGGKVRELKDMSNNKIRRERRKMLDQKIIQTAEVLKKVY